MKTFFLFTCMFMCGTLGCFCQTQSLSVQIPDVAMIALNTGGQTLTLNFNLPGTAGEPIGDPTQNVLAYLRYSTISKASNPGMLRVIRVQATRGNPTAFSMKVKVDNVRPVASLGNLGTVSANGVTVRSNTALALVSSIGSGYTGSDGRQLTISAEAPDAGYQNLRAGDNIFDFTYTLENQL